ncbi:hypothetical protein Tco_0508635 [Tanacetum coccineum]
MGTQPKKGRGKGLLTKKGVEVVVEKIETVRVPRKKRTEIVIEETEIKNDFILQQRPKGSSEGSGVIPNVPDEPSDRSESSNDKAGNVQAEVSEPEPQVKKPTVQLLSSSLTLSSIEYGNQFINDNPDVSLTDVLKEPFEVEVQSLVDVPQPPQSQPKRSKTKILLKKSKKPEEKVDADAVLQRLIKLDEKKVDKMSKIDPTDVIETSVQANMMNEVNN